MRLMGLLAEAEVKFCLDSSPKLEGEWNRLLSLFVLPV
jgi:hypothetical protein